MRKHPYVDAEHFVTRFQDQSVVDRYHLRPTYPPQTFALLSDLIQDEPRAVLDVGCGTGNIARPLAEYVARIDAVDLSLPMLERARILSGGDSPKIRWLRGRAEDIALDPPYALITAGSCLHWMDWSVVLPRFARFLSPRGMLAIVYIPDGTPLLWRDGYLQLMRRFSTNQLYQPIDWIAELEKAHLFQRHGECTTASVTIRQTIEDYIAGQHALSSLSLDAMTAAQAAQFDAEMRALVAPYAEGGLLTLEIVGGITWGKPLSAES